MVTHAGSWIVCPRSERRFRVPIWIRCTGQFPGWTSHLWLRRLCAPCPSGCVARWSSLCPWASVVLRSLQCSSLSQVRVTCCLHVPCYGSGVVIGTLPLILPVGVRASVGGSSLCPAQWHLLSGWSSLKLRVLGGYWISPLCSTDRRSASRSTCSALPPVSRLSFVLGDFSFGWGFGLCLTILLAPWGCRHAYCDPHCGSESARVLPSLLGPSPSGVWHLSRVCSSVGGPVGVAHSFHPSLLLGGGLVRFCGGLCWRSLAMSWACPPPFLCVSLVDWSRCIFAPLAPCLCWRFPSLVRVSLLRRGVSPCVWFRRSPWGVAVAPPISPYTGLVGLRQFAVCRWSSGRCFIFTARRSARIHGDHFVSFTDSWVSLTRHSHRVMFLGLLQDEWLGWLTVPLLALPGLSFALTYVR